MSPILLGYAVFSFGLSLFLLVLWLQSYVVLSSLSHLNPVFHSPVICSHSAWFCRMRGFSGMHISHYGRYEHTTNWDGELQISSKWAKWHTPTSWNHFQNLETRLTNTISFNPRLLHLKNYLKIMLYLSNSRNLKCSLQMLPIHSNSFSKFTMLLLLTSALFWQLLFNLQME